ncbi:hypothetical protein OHA18_12985 [Kribbella sp. NBC_00709]|uniref:hypothetical protein n=1 Tax=Kribbella sp. NBC_00709 TaxID=2975972 RepID=UPI002E2A9518|nr:hypothetical protein [Kribbella sp. NBC_00709]
MRRLVLLLMATVFALTGTAWAATPTDPRIAAATAAWAKDGLYVDPDFTSIADGNEMLRVIAAAKTPVYVAVVPTGAWFPEKGDASLLAGRLAAANGKPGVYIVMDGDTTYGVAHEVAAYAPDSTWRDKDETLSAQLSAYLDEIELNDRYSPEPARTEPLPTEPDPSYPAERFTVGKAIGNGLGGGLLGLIGGSILAGIVLIVAAIAARRRKGTS